MPSGEVHDKQTLFALPVVGGATLYLTHDMGLSSSLMVGFLFGGMMFGPDLDLKSKQYQRWGWIRWIWVPYQRSIPHRSPLSHGFLLGPLVRVLYLLGVVGVSLLPFWYFYHIDLTPWQARIYNFAQEQHPFLIFLALGTIGGSALHTLADVTDSFIKKRFKQRKRKKRIR